LAPVLAGVRANLEQLAALRYYDATAGGPASVPASRFISARLSHSAKYSRKHIVKSEVSEAPASCQSSVEMPMAERRVITSAGNGVGVSVNVFVVVRVSAIAAIASTLVPSPSCASQISCLILRHSAITRESHLPRQCHKPITAQLHLTVAPSRCLAVMHTTCGYLNPISHCWFRYGHGMRVSRCGD
jgi:hypothetical protein